MKRNGRVLAAFVLAMTMLSGCGAPKPAANTDSAPEGFQSYDEILEAVKKGLSEQADVDYYKGIGVSECIVSHTEGTDEEDNPIRAGYAVYDMDGDGTNELMLGIDYYEDPLILNVFTQGEEGIQAVFISREHDRYFLGENGEVYRFGEYNEGEGGSFWGQYAYSKGELTFQEGVMYQDGWYFNDTAFEAEGGKAISDDEAMEIGDTYWPVSLNLTAFE